MTADDPIVEEARKRAAAANERGDRLGEARGLFDLATVLARLGRPFEVEPVFGRLESMRADLVDLAEQAVAEARNQDQRRAEPHALFMLSRALRYVGRHEEAAHAAEQASQCLHKLLKLDMRERAERARQTAKQAIAAARERGDRQAGASALYELSSELGHARHHYESARADQQARSISGELYELDMRERADRARQAAAQDIAAARRRGDWRAEAGALSHLSSELRNIRLDEELKEEAARAAEQARRISRERRARERVESATRAVSTAQAHGDQAAEALALLTLGQALVVLERPAEAGPVFEQAEQLAYDLVAATKLAAADTQHRAPLLTGLSMLGTLGKALAEAGWDDVARHVTEQAGQLDPAGTATAVQPAEGNRVPAVTNHAEGAEAGSVIQVGVVHGNLTVHNGPRRLADGLQVSVTTRQNRRAEYYYDEGARSPDTAVHLLIEAFTAQAVILRQIRPVVVRRIGRFGCGVSYAMASMPPTEFQVRLDLPDRPHSSYGAMLDEQALDLDAAFAVGTADFPFYVTADDPEYFVIVPQPRRTSSLIEWRLELDWSCLKQHGTVTIDYGRRPFLSAP